MITTLTQKKRNVLFIDDESSIVNSLKMVFKRVKSLNTYITTSPEEAISLVEKEHFHVIVSDMEMPGMNGTALLSEIKKKSPNTLRILLTAYAEIDDILSSINSVGVYRFLEKPWVNKDIKDKVLQAANISSKLWDNEEKSTMSDLQHASLKSILGNKSDYSEKNAAILFIGEAETDTFTLLKNNTGVPVYSASNTQQAIDLLLMHQNTSVVVVHLDAQSQGPQHYSLINDSTSLLKTIKSISPSVVSIVISHEKDTKSAISLINEAQVFRYLSSPLSDDQILDNTLEALHYSTMIQLNPLLASQHQVEQMDNTALINQLVQTQPNDMRL